MIDWSLAIYIFCLVAGLGLGFASGFLGDILGHAFGGHEVGVAHDIGGHAIAGHEIAGHEVHAGHEAHAGAHEAAADTSSPTDIASHMSPISPPVISTFLTMFGLFGIVGEEGLKLPPIIAAPGAGVVSIGLAAGVFYALAKLLSVSQGTSHVALRDLVGTDAEVITPIPANGVGEIAYVCETGRASLPARSEAGTMIPKHSMVVIMEIVGNTALVRETVDEQLRAMAQEKAAQTGASERAKPPTESLNEQKT